VALSFPEGSSTGYAAGMMGHIIETTDGGATWNPIAAPDTVDALNAIFFKTNSLGFVATGGSVIFRTTDGGSDWTPETLASSGVASFSFPSDTVIGYACGVNGAMLKTLDGGLTWTAETTGVTSRLARVVFLADDQTGYAVGDQTTIIKTVDGGDTWQLQNVPVSNHNFLAVAFPGDGQTGYVAGDQSIVLKTVNGGVGIPQTANRKPQTANRNSAIRIAPNPFRSRTVISCMIPRAGKISLRLYDATGRLVQTLAQGLHGSGTCSFIVPRTALSSAGVYFAALDAPGIRTTNRFVLIR
jgi:photosystem II stability/assembly factor-like uncharacterized protein